MVEEFIVNADAWAAPLIAAAALAAFLTARRVAAFAARRVWLPDLPNGRSSHARATSRAGGVAILCGWFAGLALIVLTAQSDPTLIAGFMALSSGAFFLGLADDRHGLSPLSKLAGQTACAAAYCAAFGGLAAAPLPFAEPLSLGVFGVVLSAFWIVAFMNAFNFMDGANGLASGCAIVLLAGLAAVAASSGGAEIAPLALILVFALGGFFRVNFPNGRLFMGDAGSQGVGFAVAALALHAARPTPDAAFAVSPLFMVAAAAPLLADVAFTLAHRAVRGQVLFNAHREHAYQLLLRLGANHVQVAAAYVAATLAATLAAWASAGASGIVQWLVALGTLATFFAAAAAVLREATRAGLVEFPREGRPAAVGEPGAADLPAFSGERPALPRAAE
ncbi:MAG: hypothetical protein AAGC56_12205 [Pseudomonadota bacterium]